MLLQALDRVLKPAEHVDEHSDQGCQVSHSALSLPVVGGCEVTAVVSDITEVVLDTVVVVIGACEVITQSSSLHSEISMA